MVRLKSKYPEIEAVESHSQILEILHTNVDLVIEGELAKNNGKESEKSEAVRNAFLFFRTKIAVAGRVALNRAACLKIVE